MVLYVNILHVGMLYGRKQGLRLKIQVVIENEMLSFAEKLSQIQKLKNHYINIKTNNEKKIVTNNTGRLLFLLLSSKRDKQ